MPQCMRSASELYAATQTGQKACLPRERRCTASTLLPVLQEHYTDCGSVRFVQDAEAKRCQSWCTIACSLAQHASPVPAAQLASLIASCSQVLSADTAGVQRGAAAPLLRALAKAPSLDDAGAAQLSHLCSMLPSRLNRTVVQRTLEARG